MSFGFLPLPVYVSLCLLFSISLFNMAMKRKQVDRIGLIVMYITMSIWGVITAGLKVFEEKTSLYILYPNAFWVLPLVCGGVFFAEILYLSFTHKGDEISKRKIRIGLGIMGATFSFALIMFLILD